MTINQKSRLKKNNKIKKVKNNKGLSQPQIKGLTLKVYTMTPKKPNSALRKVAKVKVKIPIKALKGIKGLKRERKERIITVYIPGEKHKLTTHNIVLIRGGRTKDLPGLKYKIIRGALDCK